MRNSRRKILRMTALAMLVALVVVLQVVSALVSRFGGGLSITLTLVPVVVGAILFGKRGGAILGFSFGAIVLINCIIALDMGGAILWAANPFLTAALCLLKGIAAGFVPAVLYALICGKNKNIGAGRKYGAALIAAISAPVVNTGIFLCGMFLFFRETLFAWAGDTSIVIYVLTVLVGINFIIELLTNIILTPAIVRIVDVVGKKYNK